MNVLHKSRAFPGVPGGGWHVLGALLAALVLTLGGCTRGDTGIFADIEQEVKIRSNNLVDNTFIASMAASGDYFYAVAGTGLFRRPISGNAWRRVSPSNREASSVAVIKNGATYEVYVILSSDGKNTTLQRAVEEVEGELSSWEVVLGSGSYLDDPVDGGKKLSRLTGVAAIDRSGDNSTPDTLLVTMRQEGDNKQRYLAVDPQKGDPQGRLHRFGEEDDENVGDDLIPSSRPPGKAFVAGDYLWIARNSLWRIKLDDLEEDVYLTNIAAPLNLGAVEPVTHNDDTFLVAATLTGGLYKSPNLPGSSTDPENPEDWDADSWGSHFASRSRAFASLLWLPDREILLAGTITSENPTSRDRNGYYHARPNEDFDGVSWTSGRDISRSYGSADLSSAAVTGLMELGGLVFALTDNHGLWSTSSYNTGTSPTWVWE
ncbi:hypothetical protein AU468_01855 [Alkalispirochaeta sphaeroplastigenens]|uniref:Uncharacterized protein n=1 Tax=Alkalispirochaeta sphaeroplastigenens TaxID=1187066 RepID=A0A2S4K0H0_9SPIO|nr:hypothetical protein [Alkalispirochaeta sphaeroplastigenens]POR05257.1 hypothetical protein AU468_01855 [Alkalispirochaeta sphaeroplastigenens]